MVTENNSHKKIQFQGLNRQSVTQRITHNLKKNMERKEKGVEREREAKKQQLMMKRGVLVGKRAGPSTPSPRWRLPPSPNHQQQFLTSTTAAVSARKLCANHLSLVKLPKRTSGFKQKPPYQPESASSLRTLVLMQHHPPVERNGRALQSISHVSYASSVEVAPYNPPVTATSFVDLKDKLGESSYSLKTSTELVKVLNRIWSLEEQHVSNSSLVKALKVELDHCRAKMKELLGEKQTDRQEMNDLRKRAVEKKNVSENKEQDRIKAAVQSVRGELEDERKLRKRSESLHRKLTRQLSEIKSSLSSVLKELERERKARILLENLCDEFAKGITEYEEEVRFLRLKPETDYVDTVNSDRLILHISEAWLDERMQRKIAKTQNNLVENNTIVDKLSLDIENFLQAKRFRGSRKYGNLSANDLKNSRSYWHYLDSSPLNEAVSAPQDAADEEYSTDTADSLCFEWKTSAGRKQSKCISRKHGTEKVGTNGLNSKQVVDDLIRSHSLSSEGYKIHPESDFKEDSCGQSVFRGHHPSPVQKWMPKFTSPDFQKSESSLKLPRALKDTTLKERLLEARLESQHSRTKASRGS